MLSNPGQPASFAAGSHALPSEGTKQGRRTCDVRPKHLHACRGPDGVHGAGQALYGRIARLPLSLPWGQEGGKAHQVCGHKAMLLHAREVVCSGTDTERGSLHRCAASTVGFLPSGHPLSMAAPVSSRWQVPHRRPAQRSVAGSLVLRPGICSRHFPWRRVLPQSAPGDRKEPSVRKTTLVRAYFIVSVSLPGEELQILP